MIPIFYSEIIKVSKQMKDKTNMEFIFIDDGSKDNTLKEIKRLSEIDKRVKFISFSRNFGKESAMYAGLKKSVGDYVAIMDVDLQDPPQLIVQMYSDIIDGNFDCIATRRVTRKGEPPVRSFFARVFYFLMNKISKTEIVDGARDFRLMTRQFVDSVLSLSEYNRFSKGIFSWVGFKTKWLEYENIERAAGETKWSFWKLLMYSLDGIVAFSTVPLAVSSVIGMILCFFSTVMIFAIIIKTLLFGDPVAGWPSMICIILLLSGVQLLFIGVLGQYLSKTYLETKHRPLYIVKEET